MESWLFSCLLAEKAFSFCSSIFILREHNICSEVYLWPFVHEVFCILIQFFQISRHFKWVVIDVLRVKIIYPLAYFNSCIKEEIPLFLSGDFSLVYIWNEAFDELYDYDWDVRYLLVNDVESFHLFFGVFFVRFCLSEELYIGMLCFILQKCYNIFGVAALRSWREVKTGKLNFLVILIIWGSRPRSIAGTFI